MNRNKYFEYVDGKIVTLAVRIKTHGKQNILNLHIHSETFFAHFINILLDYNVVNLNEEKSNSEAIDLIDRQNKIIVQVSATATKQKIESCLEKEIFKKFKDFKFKFITIVEDAKNLKKQKFRNPHNVDFSPEKDIYDIKDLSDKVLYSSIDKQKQIFDFIKKELGDEPDIINVNKGLIHIINILSNEDLSRTIDSPELNPFEINKKIIFNDLIPVEDIIWEYKIFYHTLDEIYEEFDKQGVNKSISVLRSIKNQYVRIIQENKNNSTVFFLIIDSIIEKILHEKPDIDLIYEELEMCVNIIVVDAFIRCKIFKNPEGYNHVIAR